MGRLFELVVGFVSMSGVKLFVMSVCVLLVGIVKV